MESSIFSDKITKKSNNLIEYTSYAFLISGGMYYINYSGQRYFHSCKYFNNTVTYISGISLIVNILIIQLHILAEYH